MIAASTVKELREISGAGFMDCKKALQEVGGDLEKGTELVLESIAHFPTLYRLKDSDGKIWTLPVHSVESIK